MATYSFVVMITLTIVIGVIRHLFFEDLPTYDPQHIAGTIPVHHGSGLAMGATILVLLQAFANGGSSLTGVEAISNAVNVFRDPQGANARRVSPQWPASSGSCWPASATWPTPRTPPRVAMNTRRCSRRSPGPSSATA